jgi:transcriptional regulator with XRE-family HTH domain
VEFPDRVQKALEVLDINKVAANFEVASSTVLRWVSGIARPHPRKKAQILRELAEMVEESQQPDSKSFAEHIQEALETLDKKEIARRCEISTSLVDRYARGSVVPGRWMQKFTLEKLKDK